MSVVFHSNEQYHLDLLLHRVNTVQENSSRWDLQIRIHSDSESDTCYLGNLCLSIRPLRLSSYKKLDSISHLSTPNNIIMLKLLFDWNVVKVFTVKWYVIKINVDMKATKHGTLFVSTSCLAILTFIIH